MLNMRRKKDFFIKASENCSTSLNTLYSECKVEIHES